MPRHSVSGVIVLSAVCFVFLCYFFSFFSLGIGFCVFFVFFFFQAEDGIRDRDVTGVQTCALPICALIVFGGLSLLLVRQSSPVERIRRDFWPVVIAIGSQFVSLHRQGIIVLLFPRRPDLQLCVRRHFAVGTVLDDLVVHVCRALHGGKKRDVTP